MEDVVLVAGQLDDLIVVVELELANDAEGIFSLDYRGSHVCELSHLHAIDRTLCLILPDLVEALITLLTNLIVASTIPSSANSLF